MTRLLIRSFLLRALLPHAMLFAALVARDLLLWPEPAASAAPHLRTAPEVLVLKRGLFSAALLALGWGSCLTLCGFFRGRTPEGEAGAAPAAPERYGRAVPVAAAAILAALALVVLAGCLPGWKAGLWNLGAALASALWLFRRFHHAVAPGLRPAWEEALRLQEQRAARLAQRGEIVRRIAAVDAQIARYREGGIDPVLAENQTKQLTAMRQQHEMELHILDTRS